MPISRKEFEGAKDPLGEQALAFLANNPTEAFTLQEIVAFLDLMLLEARVAWQLMTAPTEDEAHRVIRLMLKYGDRGGAHASPAPAARRLL